MKVALYLISFLYFTACSTPRFQSIWKNKTERNTRSNIQTLSNNNILINVENDDLFLYTTFVISNKVMKQQIYRQGLILWIDPRASNDKNYGIKFPVFQKKLTNSYEKAEPFKPIELALYDRDEDEFIYFSINELTGLKLSYLKEYDNLILSLKFPFVNKNEYMPRVNSEKISIGLESITPNKKARVQQEKTKKQGISRKNRNSGQKSGRQKRQMKARTEPISFWATISLAKES